MHKNSDFLLFQHLSGISSEPRPAGTNPTGAVGYLSLGQISELMAKGALSQHQQLTEAHSSQVYATDLDEFVDFHAWQSVNVNPSTEQGVHP